jgi:ABC-type phosphate transport system auxiliary subunit
MDAGYKGTGATREYDMRSSKGNVFKRRHRLAGQGYGMLKKLGGRASRYVWPAAERKIPQAMQTIQQVLDKFTKISKGQF